LFWAVIDTLKGHLLMHKGQLSMYGSLKSVDSIIIIIIIVNCCLGIII